MTLMTWLKMRSANSTGACLLSHSCMVLTMTFVVSIFIQLVVWFQRFLESIFFVLSVYKTDVDYRASICLELNCLN